MSRIVMIFAVCLTLALQVGCTLDESGDEDTTAFFDSPVAEECKPERKIEIEGVDGGAVILTVTAEPIIDMTVNEVVALEGEDFALRGEIFALGCPEGFTLTGLAFTIRGQDGPFRYRLDEEPIPALYTLGDTEGETGAEVTESGLGQEAVSIRFPIEAESVQVTGAEGQLFSLTILKGAWLPLGEYEVDMTVSWETAEGDKFLSQTVVRGNETILLSIQ